MVDRQLFEYKVLLRCTHECRGKSKIIAYTSRDHDDYDDDDDEGEDNGEDGDRGEKVDDVSSGFKHKVAAVYVRNLECFSHAWPSHGLAWSGNC